MQGPSLFHEIGVAFCNGMTYVVNILMAIGVIWLLVTYYWVLRRGGLVGLYQWIANTKRRYGYDEGKFALSIVALFSSAMALSWLNYHEYLVLGFAGIVNSFLFLFMAIAIRGRLDHWPIIKTSALEVVLKQHP